MIIIETKDKLFSCVGSYQKMFKTFEVRKNCFRTIFAFLIISHVKIDAETIYVKIVLESSFDMYFRKVSIKTVAFSNQEKLKETKRDIFF